MMMQSSLEVSCSSNFSVYPALKHTIDDWQAFREISRCVKALRNIGHGTSKSEKFSGRPV